jgi:Mn-dependent DtxR family transcriptional regulator
MKTARQILQKIQEISKHYFSGTPPIDINGLTDELQLSKEEVIPRLRELEQQELISFPDNSKDSIRLTDKGTNKLASP